MRLNSKDAYIEMSSALSASNRNKIYYNLISSNGDIDEKPSKQWMKNNNIGAHASVRYNLCPTVAAAKNCGINKFLSQKGSTCTVMHAMRIFDENFKMSWFVAPGGEFQF